MRVLILTPEYENAGGGIATYYRALVPALCAAGADVRLIEGSGLWAETEARRRELDGARVETLERARLELWIKRFPGFAAVPSLRRHLAAAWAMWEQVEYGAGFDVVEAVDWGLSFIPPAIEASLPLFVQCHGSIGQIADHDPVAGQAADELLARLLERCLLFIVSTVQTHDASNADFWRGESGREIRVELPAWKPPARGEASEVGRHGLVVGRLQRWKGPSVLCEALQRLGQDAPQVDWYGRDTVWGSHRLMSSEHLARLYPDIWGGRFIYHGRVAPAEVARLQSRASFNVIPSTWDVFNFTVVEAMASGRPTIVSTGAGASELVKDSVNGFLFPAGDADALADAIRHVLREAPDKLAAIGQQARRTILEKLDPKTAALRRLEGYAATIKAFKSSPPKPTSGWLATACRPSGTGGQDLSFLENVPISALLKHSAARISRRLRSR